MLSKILLLAGLVSTGLLLIMLTTTTPVTAGATGIFGIFLLSYIAILAIVTYSFWFIEQLFNKFKKKSQTAKSTRRESLKRAYYFSSVISLGPLMLIGLRSVGDVGTYEFGLMALFISLGCIYVSRRLT